MNKQHEALRLADALEQDPMPMGWYLEAAAELRRLSAENETLRADAERYRWLRDHGDSGCTQKDGYGGYELRMGEELDAAIDAARSKQ